MDMSKEIQSSAGNDLGADKISPARALAEKKKHERKKTEISKPDQNKSSDNIGKKAPVNNQSIVNEKKSVKKKKTS
jgi:hypothetical protein